MGPPTELTHPRIPEPDGGPPSRSLTYDQFDIRDTLGRGGTATVHRAVVEEGPPDEVAIKRPQLASGDTVSVGDVETVVAEAERWARIDGQPHVATVIDSGTDPVPWIAVEYLAGGTLAERSGSIDPDQALWTAIAVADAVQHAHHRGVAHLDITPSNVLLAKTPSDVWDVPKVVDWGLAKPLADDADVRGFSPAYAAPEQFQPEEFGSPGPATDIYQLGAVLYELLTGTVPHGGAADPVERKAATAPEPPTDLDPSLPAAVDAALVRALEPAPEDRHRTAAQFMDTCIDLFERLADSDLGTDRATGSSAPLQSRADEADDHNATQPPGSSVAEPTEAATDDGDADGSGATTLLPPAHAPRSLAADLRAVRSGAAGDTQSIEAALSDVSGYAGDDALEARLESVRERGSETD